MPLEVGEGNQVIGLTTVDDDRLFVLRHPCKQQIEIYSTTKFNMQQLLELDGLTDHRYNGLTACATNNCLYINEYRQSIIYKVYLSEQQDRKQVVKWRTYDTPIGLSVNTERNLLVTCYGTPKLLEITPNGSLVRQIVLRLSDDSLNVWHAIQLPRDRFVICFSICHTDPLSTSGDVAEVDSQGRTLVSYRNQLQSATNRHRFEGATSFSS
jgi:hypothetical protein